MRTRVSATGLSEAMNLTSRWVPQLVQEGMPKGQRVEFRPLEDLLPYARNARTHSEAQVAELAAAILEFGWTNPVLADASGIVAGHGRVLAARLLYGQGKPIKLPGGRSLPKGSVPVLDCTGWTPAQRRAYILADNKLALNADWNAEILALELAELRDLDLDLVTGFTADEQAKLLAPAADDTAPPHLAKRSARCSRCSSSVRPSSPNRRFSSASTERATNAAV